MNIENFPILIIDGYSLFIRNFCVCPDVSTQGNNIGGLVGSLRSIHKLNNLYKPKKIIICWEGGGSKRRLSIYKDYKKGKFPKKLNRFYEDDIPETTENRNFQLLNLINILKKVPIIQFYVDDCEADDIISYLINKNELKNEKIIIVSSDKDYYQLLNQNISQYLLSKKIIVTKEDIEKEYEISINNFILARALIGDESDNIKGIKSVGFKTVVKNFPFLKNNNDYYIDDIINFSKNQKNKNFYDKILKNEEIFRRNYKLMILSPNNLNTIQIKRLDSLNLNKEAELDKIELMRLVNAAGIKDFNIHNFFADLTTLIFRNKNV